MSFSHVFAEKTVYLKTSHKSWKSLVKLKLPCVFWVIFSINQPVKQKLLLLAQTYQKRKNFHVWKCHVTLTNKEKLPLIWKFHMTLTDVGAKNSNNLQLQNHSLTSIVKKDSLLSATSVLILIHPWLTTLLLLSKKNKLYRLWGLWNFSRQVWTTFLGNYPQIIRRKLKVLKRDDNIDFR